MGMRTFFIVPDFMVTDRLGHQLPFKSKIAPGIKVEAHDVDDAAKKFCAKLEELISEKTPEILEATKESPLEQWLADEREEQVRHLRELANDLAVTSLRGILEGGVTHNAHCPQLAAALARAEWMKLEWIHSKPGWRVTVARGEHYVTETEVERVLGHSLPAKR